MRFGIGLLGSRLLPTWGLFPGDTHRAVHNQRSHNYYELLAQRGRNN